MKLKLERLGRRHWRVCYGTVPSDAQWRTWEWDTPRWWPWRVGFSFGYWSRSR